MTLGFLVSSAEADNPLDPITPMRLAFLIRNALADLSPAAGPETAVYDEVWARRHELADRARRTLEAYRYETIGVGNESRVWDLVDDLRSLLVAAATLTLFAVGGTVASLYVEQAPISRGLWTAVAVAGLFAIVGRVLKRVVEARWRQVGTRAAEMYGRLVAGELTEEITVMVDEIVHRDDERTRGALLHQMRAPNLVEFESPAIVHSDSKRVRHFPHPAALFCHAWSGGLPRDLVRTARACIAVQRRGKDPVPIAEAVHAIIRRDVSEVIDAAIRRESAGSPIDALLALRRLIDDDAPPHRQLATRDLPVRSDAEPLLTSLAAYLDIAVAVSEYYSVPRDSGQWATGIKSGEYPRHADLFAEAKAALTVHPAEAAWRLERALRHTQ